MTCAQITTREDFFNTFHDRAETLKKINPLLCIWKYYKAVDYFKSNFITIEQAINAGFMLENEGIVYYAVKKGLK